MNSDPSSSKALVSRLYITTGGIKCISWYQILALDSVVVKSQILYSSHGGFLTYAMHHHDESKERT